MYNEINRKGGKGGVMKTMFDGCKWVDFRCSKCGKIVCSIANGSEPEGFLCCGEQMKPE